jgi:hypothetical protein
VGCMPPAYGDGHHFSILFMSFQYFPHNGLRIVTEGRAACHA